MEVKPGYKQTEVGVIPDDWDVKHLGDLGKVVRGGSPRPAGDPRYFNGGSIPWLTVSSLTNIPDNKLFVTETSSMLTREGSLHSRTLADGLLVMVNSGARTLGVTKILSLTCCANDGIAALIGQREGDRRFLCYYLNSQTKRLREVIAAGNDQLNLNTGRISLIPVPFPEAEEQRAIAEALSDVDELLSGLDRLIAKKRDLKQAAMQQLLTGQTRLPGFHGEWEVKELGKLIKAIGDGATPSTADSRNFGGTINWVVIDDIQDEITATATTLTERGLQSCAATLWEPGTLILSTGATIGEVGIARVPVATKQGICGLVFHESEADPVFMKYWFVQNKQKLLGKAQGSSIKEVRAPTLVKFELSVPMFDEQTAIAEVLGEMDAELSALEQRREKTRALKQAMMQELLIGKTRFVRTEAAHG
jgi:type I restriction enzyme S subunit